MRLVSIALLGSLFCSSSAVAQTIKPVEPKPEIIVWNGTAFAWPKGDRKKFKDGDPILVFDVVAALDDETLTDGDCAKWSFPHKGATWCFASEVNLNKFKKSIDDGESLYEPLFGGRCTLGTSWGYRAAPGDPRTFEVIDYRGDKRLVLQSHNKWRTEFRADQKENLRYALIAYNMFTELGAIVPNSELKKGQ